MPSRFDLTKVKTARARGLRQNSTHTEMCLWQKVRNRQLGVDFRRQHPAGKYVLDFYAPAVRRVVELDGAQHSDEKAALRDCDRTQWLAERDVTVLRFWNSDVSANLPGVLQVIAAKIAELRTKKIPTRSPSLRRRSASATDLPFSRGGKERRARSQEIA